MRGRRGRRGDRAIRPLGVFLHAMKMIEDSCAGQDWSAGRPSHRLFGARTAACLPTQAACNSGPYGSASQQPHNPGHNTREEQSFVTTPPRDRLPRQTTTSSQQTSTSGRHAASDRASPAKVALHPRRPPYFCGGLRRGCPCMGIYCRSLVGCQSGRALAAADIRSVSAKRSSL